MKKLFFNSKRAVSARSVLVVSVCMLILTSSSCKRTVKDVEGNKYRIVKICNQWWMAENLRTTKLNDGTPIQEITDGDVWMGTNTPAFSWYNNDASNKGTYGALYNWYVVTSGNLCPDGWHAPSDAEWEELVNCAGGQAVAGGKLKEAGLAHWESPNTGASDDYKFTALPGGLRDMGGAFNRIGENAFFWSTANTGDGAQANGWPMNKGNTSFWFKDYERNSGFSVRCVKD